MSITVLTTGFWPTYKLYDFNVPADLISCIEIFSKFYGSKTSHQRLTWIFSLGNCNVIERIDPRPTEMQLSTYQIPLPPIEEKKVLEDVEKDRRYAIDAALVRIMKGLKIWGHQQLVIECMQMLNYMFKPDIKVIKKRIEDSIQRDYLERDKDNPNKYRYLA